MRAYAAGLVLGTIADALLGDPSRWHPVAGFGRCAVALEKRLYRDDILAGAAFSAAAVLPVTLATAVLDRQLRGYPVARTLLVATATWVAVGGRSLRCVAQSIATELQAGQPQAARALIPSLCGRVPGSLDATGMARATVESVAENTSDAVIAPLFWGAVAGPAGLVGYRAVNTLDAMIGHRSPRYQRFGTVAARVDDLANLVPARLTAGLTVLGARVVGGSPRLTWRVWRRDGVAHPSPNAGPCEASMAGALGVSLGGTTVYPSRTEQRPRLGDGPAPTVADIGRSVRLSRFVQAATVIGLLAGPGVLRLFAKRPAA